MSIKRSLNNGNRATKALSVMMMITLISSFCGADSRSEEEQVFVLFSYGEIEKGDVQIKGFKEVIEQPAGDSGEGEVAMVVTLEGDKSVYIKKEVALDLKGRKIFFALKVGGINTCGNDYRPGDALYPFYIQLVFSDGPDGLSWKKWISQKFKAMWDRKITTRRNIIYAFGNRMPKESIVTPYPGGAVISIGDDRDCGRLIHVTRDIENDYLIAFGKEMNGKLMRVIVGFEGYSENREIIPVSVSDITLRRNI